MSERVCGASSAYSVVATLHHSTFSSTAQAALLPCPAAGALALLYPISQAHLHCHFLTALLLLPTCVRSAGFK